MSTQGDLHAEFVKIRTERNEALAREQAVRKELELVRKAVPNSTLQLVSLQQQLAAALEVLEHISGDYGGATGARIAKILADGEKS
jgi:uncharacterized protein involved in exopolysaccharide biosynthesis